MRICPACNKPRELFHKHHKFHNVKWARRMYGALMNHHLNIEIVCANCNTSHAGIGLTHWTEQQFCEALGIEPRSKVKI